MDAFTKGRWHSAKKCVQGEVEVVKDIDREQRMLRKVQPRCDPDQVGWNGGL